MPLTMEDERVPFTTQLSRNSMGDGAEQITVAVDWDAPPQGVDWFFGGYKLLSAERTEVRTAGKSSTISFTLRAQPKAPESVDSLLLYDDPAGTRRAVVVPIQVRAPPPT